MDMTKNQMDALYCPTCRDYFATPGPSFPPYAAMCTTSGHMHPINGRILKRLERGRRVVHAEEK